MISLDEDSLICDLAETYHILNYRALPPKLVGVLCCGLREDSRIMRKLSNMNVPSDTLLRALIADRLQILIWQRTEDGAKGRNFPKSIYEKLINPQKEESDVVAFSSGAEFDKFREALIGKING